MDAIFKTLGDIIIRLCTVLFEAVDLASRPIASKDGTFSASFAKPGELVGRCNHGICITGTRSLTRRKSFRHAIVFSPSGGGKSTVVVMPSLLRMTRWPCSLVVHDPSGELYSSTSGYLASKGYCIRRISFANGRGSARYNPLARARQGSDMRKVASMIVRHTLGRGGKPDPFWDQSASSLISILMQALQAQAPEYRNLANVRAMLNMLGSDPEQLDELIVAHASEELFQEYKALQAYDTKVLSGIIASARAALDMWADEGIAELTSSDTLRLETFRSEPTVLYVQSHTAQLDYYGLLVSLLFEQIIEVLMRALPKPDDLDVFMILDEASSLRIPVLPIAIANLRKYRAGLLLCYQDYSQLVHLYGRYEAETIRQNALVKMYLSDQSLDTTVALERLLGKYETKDAEGQHRVRPLLTSDEIRVLPKDRALLIAGGHRPILAKLRPFFNQRQLLRRTRMAPAIVDEEQAPPLRKILVDPSGGTPTDHEQEE